MADNEGKSDGLKYAGDISIRDVKIVSANGLFLDVFNQMIDMNIYEDIASPAASGDIT
jgi:hypothetical protein